MSFKTVTDFERTIADYYDAPYAVAVDCCTHAIELCLRYTKPKHSVGIPRHTYISIPFTCEKLGIAWHWTNDEWIKSYNLEGTDIIDAAVHFERNSYIPLSFMCLSFQFKKPLSLGRGGAILCHYESDYIALKKMAYDGRFGDTAWAKQDITSIGYHYYMTPETAQMGIDKLPVVAQQEWKVWSWNDYPDCSTFEVFNK
jgi:dTDP-4-amino-4,6-dideoxygalactose transaminase|tara:strand:- start:4676 stop:5272 length:597 start_codon:yes stop_codon:yes gene_type:complete